VIRGPHRSRRALLAVGAIAALASRPAAGQGRALEQFLAERRAGGGASQAEFALPPGTVVERDVAYGEHRLQKLDVYRPEHARDVPIVVMVHGGAWRLGDKGIGRVVRNKVGHWVGGKGWILVSIDYRLLPETKPLEQARDVARALAFVQGKAGAWGGDASRIVLVGHSSGAHLATLLSADPALAAAAGAKPWRATLALDSAAFDVDQIMRDRHFGFYDSAFGSDPQEWRAASPLHRLDRGLTMPLLAVCSSLRADSCLQAQAFAAKVATLGGRVTVLPVDLSHGEVNERLGAPGAYTDQVDAFLRAAGLP
jgi:acetyl esterase/lipase